MILKSTTNRDVVTFSFIHDWISNYVLYFLKFDGE